MEEEEGEGEEEGGRECGSRRVSQWEWEIRVTTRPGEEGVPRWSSLRGVREGWVELGGGGGGRKKREKREKRRGGENGESGNQFT